MIRQHRKPVSHCWLCRRVQLYPIHPPCRPAHPLSPYFPLGTGLKTQQCRSLESLCCLTFRVHLTDIKKERVQMLITGYKIDRCVYVCLYGLRKKGEKSPFFSVFNKTTSGRRKVDRRKASWCFTQCFKRKEELTRPLDDFQAERKLLSYILYFFEKAIYSWNLKCL
jgi:hypothetical protein